MPRVFLYDLSERQKIAFPVLAEAVIQADATVADQEEAVMARLIAELGSPMGDAPTIDDALAAFDAPPARRAALVELIGIAWCDGEMGDAEAVLIDRFADEWSIGADTRIAMLDWVARQTALLSEAARLIRG